MKLKMMLSVILLFMIICLSCTANVGPDVEKSFKADFPDIAFDTIKPSPVKGIYEVAGQGRIYYFAPKEGIIITGEMYDKTKKNLTGERMQAVMAKVNEEIARRARDLPLEKAVKTGNGKHIVIEFTDPDCPFCRKVTEFFESRKDVTRYTFFTPIPAHRNAPDKVRYIFCQNDRSKALVEVMKGKLDGQQYVVCANAEVDGLINIHKSEGSRIGISATPLFVIDGKVVNGADIPKIESILKENAAGVK
jgi:thiol:disulfide interchange protein DsbC